MKMVLVAALLAAAAAAHAGDGHSEAPLRDPWVPPSARMQPQAAPETRGEALREQVEHKLRKSFAGADKQGRGSITREEARAAGLGIVADNFEAIDESRRGRVSFEDFKRFLRARGARTL